MTFHRVIKNSGTGTGNQTAAHDLSPGHYVFHRANAGMNVPYAIQGSIKLRFPKAGGYEYITLACGWLKAGMPIMMLSPLEVTLTEKSRVYSSCYHLVATDQHGLELMFERVR